MREQPCIGCGNGPCEAHHVRNGGLGRKADASETVPLCPACHRALHRMGKQSWERLKGVGLHAAAVKTDQRWRRTHWENLE